jgi:putative DNA primase/helicase
MPQTVDIPCPPGAFVTVRTITNGRDSLNCYLCRIFGYASTATCEEQVIFILCGVGANGKTTLVNAISEVLGDYAMASPVDTLLSKKQPGIPNDLARLAGAIAVFSSEPDRGRRLAEGLVKAITGREKVSARFLHREFFEFTPTFKVFLSTNHRPAIRGTDHAMWRRIRLVPFDVVIPDDQQDKDLPDKLRREQSGILNWLIQGAIEWRQNGLGKPDEVRQATEEYRKDEDVLGRFLEDCTQDVGCFEATPLYRVYCWWCVNNGESPDNNTRFGRAMTERGYRRDKNSLTRRKTYLGISVLESVWAEFKAHTEKQAENEREEKRSR